MNDIEYLEKVKEIYNLFTHHDLRKVTIAEYINQLTKVGLENLNDIEKIKQILNSPMFSKKSTRALTTSALRTYYRLSGKNEYLGILLPESYKSNEKKEFLETAYKIQKLLGACENETERLIVRCLLDSGIRRSILLSLKPKDIKKTYLYIRKSYVGNKARKDYDAPVLRKQTIAEIRKYYRENKIALEKPIFYDYIDSLGSKNGQINLKITLLIKAIGNRVNIDVTPHILRHTYGAFFYLATKDLMKTMAALGQTDSKATQRYVHMANALDTETIEKVRKLMYGE